MLDWNWKGSSYPPSRVAAHESEAPKGIGGPAGESRDVHTLFDRGYVTVTPEYRLEVSRRIKEEFKNGHEYYSAHGKEIVLPDAAGLRPTADFLSWHNEHIFLG
jgi:hypothetical protein